MVLIGITGSDGAGKGEVVSYLVNEKGFTHYSARELITEEIRRRDIEVNRKNMRLVGNALRKEDPGFIVHNALHRIQEKDVTRAVVESLRSLSEVEALRDAGGILLSVDADQKLRFQRIQKRASESDRVTFEEFQRHEELEMDDPDPHGMQKRAVMKTADYTILNNGTLQELYQQIDRVLADIGSA